MGDARGSGSGDIGRERETLEGKASGLAKGGEECGNTVGTVQHSASMPP